jgi:ribose transport system substrate-binding protein
MKRIGRIAWILLVIAFVAMSGTFAFAAGEQEAGGAGEDMEGGWVVGVSNGYIGNSWRTQMIDSIEKLGQFYMGQGLIDEIIVQNAGLDTNNQIAQIRNMIAERVDLLLIDPNSETALNPVIEEAVARGITVVVMDQPVTTDECVSVSINQETWGENLAKWLCEELDGSGDIVRIEGLAGHPANVGRVVGMDRILKQYPDVNLLASVNGNWVQAGSQQVMSDLLASYPNIDGVLAQDGMSLGVIQAYEAAGEELPIVTGETQVAFLHKWNELKNNSDFYTYAQNNPPGIGATALGIGIRLLQGKEFKDGVLSTTDKYPRVYFYDVKYHITNANFDEYYAEYKDEPPTYFPDEFLSEEELDALFQ